MLDQSKDHRASSGTLPEEYKPKRNEYLIALYPRECALFFVKHYRENSKLKLVQNSHCQEYDISAPVAL